MPRIVQRRSNDDERRPARCGVLALVGSQKATNMATFVTWEINNKCSGVTREVKLEFSTVLVSPVVKYLHTMHIQITVS